MQTSIRAAIAALCVVATVVGLSCSGTSEKPSGTSEKPPKARLANPSAVSLSSNVVSDREIQAAPSGSPERSLLEFFQAVQFQDIAAARDLMTRRGLGFLSEPRLRAVTVTIAPSLGKPKVLGVRTEGDVATARALVLVFAAGSQKPASMSPATFVFRKRRGKWRLADLSYFTNLRQAILDDQRRQAAQRR